ncbi:uncharacterized protein BJ212DRAFT_1401646 [Suillus subaureus]|uniref:Alpha-type protein kinase domain-containing protein n=1 Tax=Suillus subaureus TaxID=48587 RepID=A0A9P7J2I4_9AGAM|nr:uncharacterized protein BJ212DRAFT_1401646 [Suillus subaureus]KAG1799650.1 hypothetical protein BJ212DRAFT_1401646 [Suillus subaureus]
MTHAQYESVQLWREQIDELHCDDATEMKDVQTNLHTSPPVYATDEASNTTHSELPSRHPKKPRSPSHTTSSPTSSRAHKRVKENDHNTTYQTQGIETNDSEQDPEQSTTSQSLLSMSMSMLAVETHLPSRISSLLPATPRLFLPSQQQLEAAMKAQGSIRKQASAVCKYNSNTFRVYQIRSVKFQDIITTPLDVTSSPFDLVSISIDSNAKSMIGTAGSFKTCHPALLHTTSLSATPGPSTSQSSIFTAMHVVAKRVFFRKRDGNSKRQRFSKEDELGRTLDEANCLYWATCLMSLIYIFVDEMLQTQTVKQTVANEIPRLRLVYAAVAIPEDVSDRAGAAYLLEERIEGKFIKYINNNSAAPAHHLRGKEEKIGLFLCFAQHVQYQLTNEVVYLSNFQGSGDLLTDCQVMTGPFVVFPLSLSNAKLVTVIT